MENTQSLTYICSRRGASHIRDNKPCQDATKIWQGFLPQGYSVILAVADGHGDKKYDLSEFGSEIATQVIIDIVIEYCKAFPKSIDQLYDSIRNDLPDSVLREWKKKVIGHYKENETVEDHSNHVNENLKLTNEQIIERYGTTCLFALQLNNRVIIGQIGDGDIRIVFKDEVIRPIMVNSQLFANETYSLVSPDAAKLWRIKTHTIENHSLIAISTDGLSNGFIDDHACDSFFKNIYMNVEKFGFYKTMELVPSFLDKVSTYGSGDDVTLALCWTMIYEHQQENCHSSNKMGGIVRCLKSVTKFFAK